MIIPSNTVGPGITSGLLFLILMMPAFVVTLLNQFIYQPMVKDLGDLWAQHMPSAQETSEESKQS